MPITPPRREDVRVFATASEFRAWLDEHHATAGELFVGYYRKGVPAQAMTYVEAVEEALCYGWIDGITYGMGDGLIATRFTPRRRTSNWSASNIARVARLAAEGRMRPAGLRAFAERDVRRDATYSYEQQAELPGDLAERLRADSIAWQGWEAGPPSFRRQATHWVASAKRPETRERRFSELLDALRRGTRPRPFLVSRAERASGR
ncbi:MAG TPA: YdeI/OmpD-associated family protein [Candidatus Limnocylindria bacterium]